MKLEYKRLVNNGPVATADGEPKSRHRWAVLFRISVSIVTLVVVGQSISLDVLWSMLEAADLGWMVLALIIFWMAQFASSQRYVYIARTLGHPVSFFLSVRLHFIGLWFNQVLPSNIGGDFVKIMLLKSRMGFGLAFRTTILDRGAGLIFLLCSIVILLPLYALILPETQHVVTLGVVALAGLGGLALLSVSSEVLARCLPPRATALHGLLEIFTNLSLFCRPARLFEQTWTSAIVHFNAIIAYALAGKALGLSVSLMEFVLITPLVFLFAVLPISFAGWGVRELGSVWLFALVGVGPEQAAGMSVLFGLMLIVAGLPGLLLIPTRREMQRLNG